MRLNRTNVSKLALPSGHADAIFFDDDLSGFGLRLRAGGKRTWIVQYRVGRKQRRLTLGNMTTLDADKARRAAKDRLAEIQLGGDPQSDRLHERALAERTLRGIVEKYLEARQPNVRERTYAEIKRHLMPSAGGPPYWRGLLDRPVHEIRRAEISLERTKIEKASGPVAANRARSSLSALFAWAMREGLVDLNPVTGTNKNEESARDRVLTDKELLEVWNGCRDDDYGRIVRLLIQTGQRRQEVAGINDAELDLPGRMWTLPPDRTKNRRPHEVPIADGARAILESTPRREGRALYFGDGEGPFSGWSGAKEALDARIAAARIRANQPKMAPWVLHDIRRSVATGMADIGIAPHVIEAVLNHASGHKGGIAGVYNRASYRAEKKQALERWALHVESLLAGEASNVVALPISA